MVTTDSEEIAYVAENYGAKVIMRSPELAEDSVTLDPVIYDALLQMEEKTGVTYDFVITMQPTSPLLNVVSLNEAIRMLETDYYDCIISVVNKPHLSWKQLNISEDSSDANSNSGVINVVPNYEKRLNRQLLPPNFLETGAFVITRCSLITSETRMAGRITVYPVTEPEGIDIDSTDDWVLCESILTRKRIIFRCDGYVALGMGHVYNCITLAYSMIEHEVLLVIQKDSVEGIKKIQETNLPYRIIENDGRNNGNRAELDALIAEFKPDIWVNDLLNTEADYIQHLKTLVPRVITIEDLGPGTKYVDAAINALYTDDDLRGRNIFNGWRYVCLRDEFQVERSRAFSNQVKNVMIMFGGTDPSNYNAMLYRIITDRIAENHKDVRFNFVVGIGYDVEKHGLKTIESKNIYVYPNVQRVTRFMKEADLAITSQGRSIFEFAAMGVPAIVLSQNQRETSHSFATMRHGFINLGVGSEIQPEIIENTLDWLINTRTIRKNMYDLIMECPMRDGLARVKGIILGNTVNSMV